MFSAGLLSILVYGALIWCAVSSTALFTMLLRDLLRGTSW